MMKSESDPKIAIIAAVAILALAGCSADEIVRRGPIMTIAPTSVAIAVGDTARFRAFYLQTAGPVTWTSSAPEIATVDRSGLVRATGVGQTTVTADVRTSRWAFQSSGVVHVRAEP